MIEMDDVIVKEQGTLKNVSELVDTETFSCITESTNVIVDNTLSNNLTTNPASSASIDSTMVQHANDVTGRIKCKCGCIPDILSLFEMAELREKFRKSKKNIVVESE